MSDTKGGDAAGLIVVIDDEVIVLAAYQMLFESWGYRAVAAPSMPIEALLPPGANTSFCPPWPNAGASSPSLGPGSLYTSLITNLLVDGIAQALRNARGTRVFICNLMTQANESLGLSASQHIQRIYEHAGGSIFDYAIINTAPVSPTMLLRYAAEEAVPIEPDIDRVESMGVQCLVGNFLSEGDVLRHDSNAVTAALLDIGRLTRPQ